MTGEWAELDDEGRRIYAGLHRVLLRLAGRFPDEVTTHARRMLGSGDLAYLPDTVLGSAVDLGLSMPEADVELLRNALVALGIPDEPAAAEQVRIAAGTPATEHRFAPVRPELLASAGDRIPSDLDLTGGAPAELADLAEDLTDLADDLVVDALSEEDGVLSIRRTWRLAPDQPARRVYLVEVAPHVEAWDLVLVAHNELAAMGEEHPQVEVFWTGEDLPPYHRAAQAAATLLHRETG
ncbi:hypothetical protein [Saccharopolyspora elongata]|uniref:Uncharacterized protein n=1 Tax=Saccharopolyspora elongata TaxID=2530387 RepID=A0A4R4XUC5_9PSEU|nr:hypothetical protein [Saccharopolyspora elongata]TDD34744.1 hypothetical protein E1288_44025 [Saccharopolyspora elongata]